MKSLHRITKAALVCAVALVTAAGCAAPTESVDTGETESVAQPFVAVRRVGVVGGWGGAAVVRTGYVAGYPIAPYYPRVW
jgi:hypothetical protein